MYPELQGRVAIVTGAGRRGGLGAAMAQRLAAEGARVVLADVGAVVASEDMQAVLHDISAAGGMATAVVCDMLDGAAIESLVAQAEARYGAVDILVNNAGIG